MHTFLYLMFYLLDNMRFHERFVGKYLFFSLFLALLHNIRSQLFSNEAKVSLFDPSLFFS